MKKPTVMSAFFCGFHWFGSRFIFNVGTVPVGAGLSDRRIAAIAALWLA
jgi:hypothetical protein